jgi:hypothetical protein
MEATGRFITAPTGECSCGCSSCATTCDGQGPVLGAGQVLELTLPALPSSGRLGVMVRSRGVGPATMILEVGDEERPFGLLEGGSELSEVLPNGSGDDALFSWTATAKKPAAVRIVAGPQSWVEVDCVVPFLAH